MPGAGDLEGCPATLLPVGASLRSCVMSSRPITRALSSSNMATLAENAKGDEESGGHRVVEFSSEVNIRTKADQINHSFLVSGMYIMLW